MSKKSKKQKVKTSAATQGIIINLADGRQLNFNISRANYSSFIDDSNNPKGGKLAAMQALLMRAASDDDTKQSVRDLSANGANITELCTALMEDYKPDIEIIAKG